MFKIKGIEFLFIKGYEVRLVNGRNPREGRVEVNIGGQWGTICSDHWTLLEGTVVCQQLGKGYAAMAVRVRSPVAVSRLIILGYQCQESELILYNVTVATRVVLLFVVYRNQQFSRRVLPLQGYGADFIFLCRQAHSVVSIWTNCCRAFTVMVRRRACHIATTNMWRVTWYAPHATWWQASCALPVSETV